MFIDTRFVFPINCVLGLSIERKRKKIRKRKKLGKTLECSPKAVMMEKLYICGSSHCNIGSIC